MSKFENVIKHVISEAVSAVHISVDVQQDYIDHIPFDIREYYQWMYDNFSSVIVYVNGEELGFPSKDEHTYWLLEQGFLEESMLHKFDFREKGYAFFRSCIDGGYEECLVEVIQYMRNNDVTDSRDLTEEQMVEIRNEHGEQCSQIIEFLTDGSDPIYIPDLMNELSNDNLTLVSVSGGGDNECLEEVRLALSALNVKHTDVRRWVY